MQGGAEHSGNCTQRSYPLVLEAESDQLCVPAEFCFPSNLHVTGFSSWRITSMIHSYLAWFLLWLRHGAIGPIEATPVGVNVDWIDFRINTFELVIHLVKCNSRPCGFSAFSSPAVPAAPGTLVFCILSWEAVPNFRNLLFGSNFTTTQHHAMTEEPGRYTTFRCGLFSFGFLVRWNMLCT